MEASDITMAAPPPPPPQAGEEELQDRDEVLRRVHERLRQTAGRQSRHDQGQPELVDPAYPSFERRLYKHLQRMPQRYLADIDADDKAEDALLHMRILDDCADPSKRSVFHARHLKSITVRVGMGYDYNGSDSRTTSFRVVPLHIHEIIFCSLDKPKLLCMFSLLLDDAGLHIREGHLHCTSDGFCLANFLVDGWNTEETGGLIVKIMESFTLRNFG